MMQYYKAVYFPDHPADAAKERSVTLAFGHDDQTLYDQVKNLSSEEVRQLMGSDSYQHLLSAATVENLSFNAWCLQRLEQSVAGVHEAALQYSLPGMPTQKSIFDPVSVTFRGGAKEPYQRWYSYLEGYSPEYVKAILERYSPDSRVVLDPFSGTGTTAFASAATDRTCYFCEINPVLQFISRVKIKVRMLPSKVRTNLANAVDTATQELSLAIETSRPDENLGKAYDKVFRDSRFFDPRTYDQILRTRTWIDEISRHNPLLADLLAVAALAALVPSSRMQRAGDLRYKTRRELDTKMLCFPDAFQRSAGWIAQDLRKEVPVLFYEPRLVCENARSLGKVPFLNVDAVITSPPYVNGTNYFRNTKIELWFLRCLHNKSDLAAFRAASVTSGINGVTAQKIPNENHPEVEKVLRELTQRAYDSRIPRMVASYFNEMSQVFAGVCRHLTLGAIVAVDIGDSAYANVHVPSDELLVACFRDIGLDLEDEVVLRRRRSRGGSSLKQSLLIFRYRKPRAIPTPERKAPRWEVKWNQFKQELPHQSHPYNKRNWGHGRHSLCSYAGKLKPAIAHHLVEMFVPASGSVLDPFAGVGTIPFEASLNGRLAYGFDLSPLAVVISGAKLQHATADECEKVVESLDAYISNNEPTAKEIDEARTFGFNGKLVEYYHPHTLEEIILARRFFQNSPQTRPAEMLVMASLLHILHGNRPYALSRRSHPLTPYRPTGEFEYRPLIPHLRDKIDRTLSAVLPPEFRPGTMFLEDATSRWPSAVGDLDAIITSPPFFDSTRFHIQNWLRLWFVGWSEKDFDDKPLGFVDERQKDSFRIYEPVLRQARERLKPGGVVVLHLGKSTKCDMGVELEKIARQWFSHTERFDESVTHCESHGMRDKGTVTDHQYLMLY